MNKNFTTQHQVLIWFLLMVLFISPQIGEGQTQPMAKLNSAASNRKAQTSLQEILDKLQQHYGVAFVYESDLVSEKVVVDEVKLDKNLENVLRSLLDQFNMKYKKLMKHRMLFH